jgi:hypothetical protein
VSHDPEILLANYKSAQKKIADLRQQLKAILADALNNNGSN